MRDITLIAIETSIDLPEDKTWEIWTSPAHIIHWNYASTEWHCPKAENDLVTGGRFLYRMESRDGSIGFDFCGTYTTIDPFRLIEFTLDDGRKVGVSFSKANGSTVVRESFEAEKENSPELQQAGWQAILDNFKRHAESRKYFEKLNFSKIIHAPAKKVFDTMISQEGFSSWTSAFTPLSFFEGSWEKGEHIRFLSEDENGNPVGMASRIRENIPGRFISIEHIGSIGPHDKTTGNWNGALEEYFLEERDGQTTIHVSADTTSEFREYFEKTWPKALERLKEFCERE